MRWLVATIVAVLLAAPAHASTLTQLEGPAGCVARSISGCAPAVGLRQVSGLAFSPDGTSLYAVSSYAGGDHALTSFQRDATTGALTQTGCVTQLAKQGCVVGHGLRGVIEVVVSPDGRHVYTAAPYDTEPGNSNGYIAAFSRDPVTGTVTQLQGTDGCLSQGGRDGCSSGRALDGANGIAISPDGRFVYAAAGDSDALAVFARDATSGALRQLPGRAGCISERSAGGCAKGRGLADATSIAISPDGRNAYATASLRGNAVTAFSRDAATGRLTQLANREGCISAVVRSGCRRGRGLRGAVEIAIAPDGKTVYAAAFEGSAVTAFARGTAGRLRQLGDCADRRGREGCARTPGLSSAIAVAVAPDNQEVYAAGALDDAVVALTRTPTGLTFGSCAATRITGCARARGMAFTFDVVVSPDGRNVYVAASDDSAIAVFSRSA